MTITDAELGGPVAAIHELVAADGGEVQLVGVDATTVQLRLVLEGSECRECVMPRSFLEQVALDMIRAEVPAVTQVAIDDPREADG